MNKFKKGLKHKQNRIFFHLAETPCAVNLLLPKTRSLCPDLMPSLLEPNSTLSKRRSAVMEILWTKPEILHLPSRGILNKDRRSEILSFLSQPIVRSYMSLLRKRASKSEDGGLGNNKSYIGDTISFALPEKETRGISEVKLSASLSYLS